MRPKQSLTASDAEKMMAACKAEAAANNWNVSIAIVDEAGFLLRFERLDGAGLMTADVAQGKARSAALARAPTQMLGELLKTMPGLVTIEGYTLVQGGLPITYEGECVGGIGVSGVQSHHDEQIAHAGIAALSA